MEGYGEGEGDRGRLEVEPLLAEPPVLEADGQAPFQDVQPVPLLPALLDHDRATECDRLTQRRL